MCKTLVSGRRIIYNFRKRYRMERYMRLVIKKLIPVSATLVLLIACGNNNNASPKTKTETHSAPFNTAELLKYDPKKADKRIDEFFHKLHNKSAFNGNILV